MSSSGKPTSQKKPRYENRFSVGSSRFSVVSFFYGYRDSIAYSLEAMSTTVQGYQPNLLGKPVFRGVWLQAK